MAEPSYTIHIKDEETGIVMEWVGMSQDALDWITKSVRLPSTVCEVFGPAHSTFFEPEEKEQC